MEDFRRALEINPHFLEAAYFLGMSLLHIEDYRAAEEAFDQAMAVRADATDGFDAAYDLPVPDQVELLHDLRPRVPGRHAGP